MTVTHNGKQYTAKSSTITVAADVGIGTARQADAEPLADAYRWPPETGWCE
ncbi:hypothetical protein [Enterobacter roggenkampii]|uniref:hypothetical protein n=1 Tax=Enterobacter roggenkampii TaxID=1812935 RepID=UPI001432AE48|nr:hypothetical protein [Enterobacter roggenkampii]